MRPKNIFRLALCLLLCSAAVAQQENSQSPAASSSGRVIEPVKTTVVVTATGAPTFILGDSGHNWSKQDAYRGRVEFAIDSKTAVFVQYLRQK